MSEITNFPVYKQKENIITNYTLFLFKRLYNYDLNKFEVFINTLIESETNIVPKLNFGQQAKTESSVVDGFINQESFKILIETKKRKNFSTSQINNHLTGFQDEDQKIMLLIGSEPLKDNYLNTVRSNTVAEYNKEMDGDSYIELYNTTFNSIINVFREVVDDYDFQMHELIDDYEIFCEDKNILDKRSKRMRYVPCGSTFDLNLKYNLYYMPASRGYKSHKYLGIYKNKCIRAVGKIKKISVANYNKNTEELKVIEGDDLSKEEEKKIIKVINEAYDKVGHKIHQNTRFFLTEELYETNFYKKSKYGVPGARYHNLEELLNEDIPDNTKKLADILNNYEF